MPDPAVAHPSFVDRYIVMGVRLHERHEALWVVTAILLVVTMSSGIDAFARIGRGPAISASIVLLWVTVLLRVAMRWAGRLARIELGAAFGTILGSSILLAIAGVAQELSADRIATIRFTEAAAAPFGQIDRAQLVLETTAQVIRAAAVDSVALSGREATEGGTCGVPTKPIPGAISKMRAADARVLGKFATDIDTLSANAGAAKREAQSAISGYRLDRHAEAARVFADALKKARTAVASPRIDEALRFAAQRGARSFNPETNARVTCPTDPLSATLAPIGRQQRPPVPVAPAPPEKPTHANTTTGLVEHLLAIPTRGFDCVTYGPALIGGLLDIIFQSCLRIPTVPVDPQPRGPVHPFRRIARWLNLPLETPLEDLIRAYTALREEESIVGAMARGLIVAPSRRGKPRYYLWLRAAGDEDAALRNAMDVCVATGEVVWKASGPAGSILKGADVEIAPDTQIDLFAIPRRLWSDILQTKLATT